jgi:hypothetical protein
LVQGRENQEPHLSVAGFGMFKAAKQFSDRALCIILLKMHCL